MRSEMFLLSECIVSIFTYHRLAQVFQQKAEAARRICHGICAMKNHKAVKSRVVELNLRPDSYPVCLGESN